MVKASTTDQLAMRFAATPRAAESVHGRSEDGTRSPFTALVSLEGRVDMSRRAARRNGDWSGLYGAKETYRKERVL